jgi:hypothetical protein
MRRSTTIALSALILATTGTVGFWGGATVTSRSLQGRLGRTEASLTVLQQRLAALDATTHAVPAPTGTAGPAEWRLDAQGSHPSDSAALVEAIAARVQRELGVPAPRMLRERRASFVELYTADDTGTVNYGTAGYLGENHFITVKHAVVALGASRRIESIRLKVGNDLVDAELVDAGDARSEVDPGDWAVLRTHADVSLPPLRPNLRYPYPFGDAIVRMGNDYSKGVIAAGGYVGEHTGGLVTSLTDGHPGVSGGGVLNHDGELVGIPVGRMQGDYRFSFILPLRAEMFRKVPGLGDEAPALGVAADVVSR